MHRNAFPLCAVLACSIVSGALAAPQLIATCGITIAKPGSYVVDDDLDSVGNCLVVNADGVTIDLGGHVIHGDGTGAGINGPAGAANGLVVRNGTIMNFEIGLLLDNAVVESIRSIGNAAVGIQVDRGVVRDSFAMGTAGNGIAVGAELATGSHAVGNVVGIYGGIGANVVGNVASDNKAYGIFTGYGSAAVANNAVAKNAYVGIYANCPTLVLGNASDNGIVLNGANCKSGHNIA